MAIEIRFVSSSNFRSEVSDRQNRSDGWQRCCESSQDRRIYDGVHPRQMLEGGREYYRGFQLLGHYDAVQRIKESLDIVWLDDRARTTVQANVKTIMCVQLNGSYGWSYHDPGFEGIIAIDPYSQDALYRAGTIYHEALEYIEGNHDRIFKLQRQFRERVARAA